MKEFFQNVFAVSNERVKNPFVGSFILSLIVFNWKAILTILLSNQTIEDRITYVTTEFSKDSNALLYSLIFSVSYTIVLPYLMWLIDALNLKPKTGRKKALFDERIFELKEKQRVGIEERKYQEIKAGGAEIAELNSQIAFLNGQVEEKQKQIDVLRTDLQNVKKEKEELEINRKAESDEIAGQMSQKEEFDFENEYYNFINTESATYFEVIGLDISQYRKVPHDIPTLIIEKFIYAGLIKKTQDAGSINYDFTKKGRFFWKKYVLSKKVKTKQEEELPF